MAINYGKLNAKLTPRGSLKATMGVSGPLNSDYEALINKPQINGNELIGDKSNADLGIPTALEDLTDDSTHRVVTDEQISAWNNKSDFSGSYDDLTDKPTIPDELADLTDDSTHRLVTDTEKTTWNAKSDFSGSYNDLTDVPANLVQDANYVHTDNNYDDTAKGKVNALGTASTKNVPVSGDASISEVVLGNDTRLTDDRNAKDVYSWAKASTKPSYTATEVGAIASTLKGTANGVAELDANGKVPSAQLPSYVDDVLEYASTSAFPQTGESGKIYIALDTNKTYRWGGSAYVEISESLALGETDSTAYAGNKGKQNADNIATIQGLIPSSATTSNKLATANDIPDISGKADKSEMSVSSSNDLTTIQLKSGTSATVINAHQDISGKANKSEMSVSTSGDKTTIQLKSGTSAEVLNQHQDISGKVDKVEGKGLSTNDYDNTAKGIVDGVTSALNDKVDKVQGKGLSTNDYDNTAKGIVDGVTSALADKVDKVNGKGLSTEDYTTAEKSKLGDISENAKKVASSSTNGHIEIDDVDTTVYDDTAVQNAIENIEDELSTDYATAEGNPINFSTKSAQNAKSTILSVEPIQDLHGYDKPWVGGAGKNLLPMTVEGIKAINTSGTWNGNTYTKSDIQFTILTDSDNNVQGIKVNGTKSVSGEIVFFIQNRNSSNFTLPADSYYINGFPQNASRDGSVIRFQATRNGSLANLASTSGYGTGTIGEVQNGDLLQVTIVILGNATINNSIYCPMIRKSTETDATFAPYTNICPISGRSEIGILGCGKNLLPMDGTPTTIQGVKWTLNDDGSISAERTSTSSNNSDFVYKDEFTLGAGSYIFNCFYGGSSAGADTFQANVNIGGTSHWGSGSYIFTLSEDTVVFVVLRYYPGYSNKAVFYPMIVKSTDSISAYSPYTESNDLTIDLGQTVYGGRIDVEKGELTITKAKIGASNLSFSYWEYSGVGGVFFAYTSSALSGAKGNSTPICDKYEGKSPAEANQQAYDKGNGMLCFRYPTFDRLYIRDDSFGNDATAFNNSLSDCNIVYELATPIAINLTPHTINLLKGVNNISTDGNKITLTYRDGKVATLGDLTSAVDELDEKIDESKILTDTATGDKYILVVTNGVLSVEQISN